MLSKSNFEITEAIRIFNNYSVEAAYIVPTRVGLEKSIMDAISSLRSYLKENHIHNYEGQVQGPKGKVVISAFLVSETDLISTKASLYRPYAKGKDGDPRIWFSKLNTYAFSNDLLAIITFKKSLYVINMSKSEIRESSNNPISPLGMLLRKISSSQNLVANELLSKIKEIASRGWIPTVTKGDTGIGATLEDCLGININSSQTPDYKGIEIKTKRLRGLKATTRNTLFAQVPDWSISKLKSSAEILNSYGYARGDNRKLYCTVKSTGPNSQGLMLKVDESKDFLNEIHLSGDKIEDVVSWKFELLRNRLKTKHNETFWVGANSENRDGIEHFQYKKIIHTRHPFTANFHTLCHQGIITLDHLIKKDVNGKVVEKGPLFKINEANLELLFPPPVIFNLS